MLSRQLLPLVDIAGARRDKLNVGGGGRVPCLADNFIITVAVAQLAERQVVVLDVAGSSPVGHPFEGSGFGFRVQEQRAFCPEP